MKKYYKFYGLNVKNLIIPSIFVGYDYLLGYESNRKSGEKLEEIIEKNYFNKKTEHTLSEENNKQIPQYIDTYFGRINIFEQSLGILAIILGLLDGFNPCAMWVLVYLVSLTTQLNDKNKIWIIVGSFVLASGILYYLFMTALLNVFLYFGYIRILQILIGCFALYVGLINLKIYFIDKGHVSCKVQNSEAKTKTMNKIQKLVHSEISLMTILGIIALAFVINSIEFVCSAALPAIYIGVLTQAKLSILKYYAYILLYVLFFMLNNIIIFGFAVFAINKFVSEKYAVPCKLIGGIILFILGILMIFFPQLLR